MAKNNCFCGIKGGLFSEFFTGPSGAGAAPLTDAQFNALFERLNLQSNVSNFTLGGGNEVSQWRDISPSLNHATGTTTTRPILTGGTDVVFDGTDDFLALGTEIVLSGDYSIYVTFKKASIAVGKVLYGGSTVDVYVTLNVDNNITLFFTAASGGLLTVTMGALMNWNVLSIRRSGAVFNIRCNDRHCYVRSDTIAGTPTSRVGRLARRGSGQYGDIRVRSFCVTATALSDTVDLQVKQYLYTKYAVPQAALVGLGDSITEQNTWLDNLGVALSLPTVQCGISGTRLTDNDPATAALSMRRRIETDVLSRPGIDKITIMGGTNDILATVDPDVFAVDLDQMVAMVQAAGYNMRNLCLSSVPYQKFGANASTLDAYRTRIVNIKNQYGTSYTDSLQLMRDGGGDSLLTDNLHPNATGGNLIRDGFIAAFSA